MTCGRGQGPTRQDQLAPFDNRQGHKGVILTPAEPKPVVVNRPATVPVS